MDSNEYSSEVKSRSLVHQKKAYYWLIKQAKQKSLIQVCDFNDIDLLISS